MDNDLKIAVTAAVADWMQEKAEIFDGELTRSFINKTIAWSDAKIDDEGLLSAWAKTFFRFGRVAVESEGRLFSKQVDAVIRWALGKIERETGLEIEGLSEEALARAIGKRAGIVLHSLHDADVIAGDLIEAAADRLAAQMAWRLDRAIRSADDALDMIERRARGEIERRVPGLVLHDLTDAAATEWDFVCYAAARIKARTGIIFRDLRDPDRCKNDLVNWADDEVRRRLKIDGTKCGGGLKMTKKAIKNRAAQRRFKAAHGTVQKYERVT